MRWISVKDELPKKVGQYEVETNFGKSIAFYTRTLTRGLIWLSVNEEYKVIKWKKN
jgi:hypothetical protein